MTDYQVPYYDIATSSFINSSSGIVLGPGDTLGVGGGGSVTGTTATGDASNDATVFVGSGGTESGTVDNAYTTDSVAGGVASNTVLNGQNTLTNGRGEQQVYDGGMTISASVNSGGLLSIDSGGTAVSAVLTAGGEIDIQTGVGSGTTVGNGALETVESSGTAINTVVSAGGIDVALSNDGNEQLYSGGSVLLTTTYSGGTLTETFGAFTLTEVQSGGTVYDTITSGGSTSHFTSAGDITHGGTSQNAHVLAGGTLVLAGGTLVNPTVDSGGTVVLGGYGVFGGATAVKTGLVSTGLNILGGVTYIVTSGNTAGSDNIYPGGLEIVSGGTAAGEAIGSGGTLLVSAGGSAIDTVLVAGATETVLSGGTELVLKDHSADGAQVVVSAGGVERVISGGVVVSAQIAGGYQSISGGLARATTVSAGGTVAVSSGGTSIGATVLSGGKFYLLGGEVDSLTVSSGGAVIVQGQPGHPTIVSGLSVSSGGQLQVINNGVVSGASVFATGLTQVFSGGILATPDVASGGTVIINSGGVALGATVDAGGLLVASAGGTAGNLVVHSGASAGVRGAGASFVSASIEAGGTDAVVDLGVDTAAKVAGLLVVSGGTATGAEILGGGSGFVDSGGTFALGQIDSGGVVTIGLTGSALSTVVGNQANLGVFGKASQTSVTSGGAITVLSGGTSLLATISAGGDMTVSGQDFRTVVSGASTLLDVSSGGTSIQNTIEAGGNLAVHAGGSSISGTLLSGGVMLIFNGGAAISETVGSGGVFEVDGTAISSLVSGGTELVSGGGGESNATVVAGGRLLVIGSVAINTDVQAGGSMIIDSTSLARGLTIEAGGAVNALTGSIISGLVQRAGATFTGAGKVVGAADIEGTVTVSGGMLDFADGFTGSGTVIVQAGDTLELGANGTLANLDVMSGGVTQLDGGTLTTDPVTIEAGGVLSGTGVVTGDFTDNGSISVSGGQIEITGNLSGSGTLTIGGSGTLVLDGAVSSGTTIVFASNGTGKLEIGNASAFHGTVTGAKPGDTVGPTPCFAAGTRILTQRGEIDVASLTTDDLLPAHGGRLRRVRWIGHRHVTLARHTRPWDVQPVRIGAHAFGPGQPHRDLRLSPDHAVYLPHEHALIPARYLLNGATIVQEAVDSVTYYHVELADPQGDAIHDVILAEGLKVESYLDTGNRSAFANAGAIVMAQPDFARGVWEAKSCARLVLDGAVLRQERTRLLAEAQQLGHVMTPLADLRLLACGTTLLPQIYGSNFVFVLPNAAEEVTLLSRVRVPAEIDAQEQDTRRLGVAVTGLRLDDEPIALDDPRLSAGWHDPEQTWRWTAGAAVLQCAGTGIIEISIAPIGNYWQEQKDTKIKAA